MENTADNARSYSRTPRYDEDVVNLYDPPTYPTNQPEAARPDLITSVRSKWNQVNDEVHPRGLTSGKALETPATKRSVMSTQSARRRAR